MRPSRLPSLLLVIVLGSTVLVSCAKDSCPLEEALQGNADSCKDGLCPPVAPESVAGSTGPKAVPVETRTIEESFANSYRSFLYIPQRADGGKAPVILFLHGYFDATPDKYDAMLRYYASQGFIVIYPGYGNAIYAKGWADNALEAFKRALAALETDSPVKPDTRELAFVGHSIGGILALHLAESIGSGAAQAPRPKLIVTTDAAGISTIAYPDVSIDDLSHIPADTKILMMMAEDTYKARYKEEDRCEDDSVAKPAANCNGFSANLRALKRTPQIPADNKQALLISGDQRGGIVLKSDHNSAQGRCGDEKTPINALDTWGYWRHTLFALNSSLKSEGDFVQKRSTDFLKLGNWSDGTPAKPALSLDGCFAGGQCPKLE